ncbi:MAG: pantetheine-phosphate adenylyltransferase [Bdellovibrionia bacterium]
MSQIAVYPGSFDPITIGHTDIIERIAPLYEKVIILIAHSPQKQSLFTVEERKLLIEKSLPHIPNLEVDSFDGLTVDYMKQRSAKVIIRGLRAVVDFEYEMTMASMNKKLAPSLETLLVFARPEYYFISSRGVKEIALNRGDLTGLVSPAVNKALVEKMR